MSLQGAPNRNYNVFPDPGGTGGNSPMHGPGKGGVLPIHETQTSVPGMKDYDKPVDLWSLSSKMSSGMKTCQMDYYSCAAMPANYQGGMNYAQPFITSTFREVCLAILA